MNLDSDTPYAEGFAAFLDYWTFTNRPLDTPGVFRVSFHLEGAATADSGPHTSASAFGRLNVQMYAHDGKGNGISIGLLGAGNIEQSAVNAVYASDPVSFLYGRPFSVSADLEVYGRLGRESSGANFMKGHASAQFGNTATLSRVEVRDANGNWTAAFNLATESGARYPFQNEPAVPVTAPEPATGLMALGFVIPVALAAVRRRRLENTQWQ